MCRVAAEQEGYKIFAIRVRRSFNVLHSFLTWKIIYIFPSCSGGTISFHHSFTPSHRVRHLETRGELPYEKARAAHWKI